MGVDPPLNPPSLSEPKPLASRLRGPRLRRCLLEGCERWFQPSRPQCRYCSAVCRQAARHWRHWHAQQQYRATANGRRHRQQQARHYRQHRCCRPPPAPPATPLPAATDASPTNADPSAMASALASARGTPSTPARPAPAVSCGTDSGREGKRLPAKTATADSGPWQPCDRPGCYVLFPAGHLDQPRRFCCVLCRRALRRVLDREARWRQRRRHGLRRPGRRPRPPPRCRQ